MFNKKFVFFVLSVLFCFNAHALEQTEVIVSDLPAFSQNTVGISTPFDEHIFDGSQPQDIKDILKEVSSLSPTPAVMNILTALLMQDTTAGHFNFDADSTDSFLILRLRTLFELGQWDSVLKLIEQVPQNNFTDEIAQIQIETLFLKGQTQQACALLENKEIPYYSDKMRISCFLSSEEKEKAVLSYDIYRENPDKDDPLFDQLADISLNELQGQIPQNFELKTPHIFLFATSKTDISDPMKQKVFVRKALLDLPVTDIALRLKLARFVILSQEELERVYKLPLLNEDANKALYLKRAELFRAFLEASDETQKGLVLITLLENVRTDKQTLFIYPLLSKMLSHISASSQWRDLAFDAVQIYALMGDIPMAKKWYEVLENAPMKTYQKQRLFLVPLMTHLGEKEPSDTSQLIQQFCSNQEECAHFWYMYPYQSFEQTLKQENQSADLTAKQVPFAFMQETETQKGEKILRALLELNRQSDLKIREQLLEFLKQLVPLELFRQLEKEEMVY